MKTEKQYFDEAISIQTYMDRMSTLKDESYGVYQSFDLPLDEFSTSLKNAKYKFLVITEDWCGDAMMINPIIRKISESADIDTRVVMRDEDTQLIDRYLTKGGRAIPIILILDEEGHFIGKWGPRASEVQQIVDDLHASLPSKEDPQFEELRSNSIRSLRARYAIDSTLWFFVYKSIKDTVQSLMKH